MDNWTVLADVSWAGWPPWLCPTCFCRDCKSATTMFELARTATCRVAVFSGRPDFGPQSI